MDAVLCFVSLRVDLPAIGKVRDAGGFVGLTNEHFPCIYQRSVILWQLSIGEFHASVCGPILGVPQRTAGAQHAVSVCMCNNFNFRYSLGCQRMKRYRWGWQCGKGLVGVSNVMWFMRQLRSLYSVHFDLVTIIFCVVLYYWRLVMRLWMPTSSFGGITHLSSLWEQLQVCH